MEVGTWPNEESMMVGWKRDLTSIGFARCVHPACGLCFLSLAGAVGHHKICIGWVSEADYLPCIHCGARFKQFKSCQTHVEKSHSHLFRRPAQSGSIRTSDVLQRSHDSISGAAEGSSRGPQPDVVPRIESQMSPKGGNRTSTPTRKLVTNTNPALVRARAPDGKIIFLTPTRSPPNKTLRGYGGAPGGRQGPTRLFPLPQDGVAPPTVITPNHSDHGYSAVFSEEDSSRAASVNTTDSSTSAESIQSAANFANREPLLSSSLQVQQLGSSLQVQQQALAEKEERMQEMERLVQQTEQEAEKIRLTQWERNLQRREAEAQWRLAHAQKIIEDNKEENQGLVRLANVTEDVIVPSQFSQSPGSISATSSDASSIQVPQNREEVRVRCSPPPPNEGVHVGCSSPPAPSILTSTPKVSHQNRILQLPYSPSLRLVTRPSSVPPVLPSGSKLPSSLPMVLPPGTKLPASAILLPPGTKLPASAIKLSCLPPAGLVQAPQALRNVSQQISESQDGPINLSLPKSSPQTPPYTESQTSHSDTSQKEKSLNEDIQGESETEVIDTVEQPLVDKNYPVSVTEKYSNLSEEIVTLEAPVPLAEKCSNLSKDIVTPESPDKCSNLSEEIVITPEPLDDKANVPGEQTEEDPPLPLVEVSGNNLTELLVSPLVIEEGHEENGSLANISIPFDSSLEPANLLVGAEDCLESLLEKSGGEVLTLLATEGPDGKYTLVSPGGSVGSGGSGGDVERIQSEEVTVKEIEDMTEVESDDLERTSHDDSVNSKGDSPCKGGKARRLRTESTVLSDMCAETLDNLEIRIQAGHTGEMDGDLVDYLEKQLKDLQPDIHGELNSSKNDETKNTKPSGEHLADVGVDEEHLNNVCHSSLVEQSVIGNEINENEKNGDDTDRDKTINSCDDLDRESLCEDELTQNETSDIVDDSNPRKPVRRKRKKDDSGISIFQKRRRRTLAKEIPPMPPDESNCPQLNNKNTFPILQKTLENRKQFPRIVECSINVQKISISDSKYFAQLMNKPAKYVAESKNKETPNNASSPSHSPVKFDKNIARKPTEPLLRCGRCSAELKSRRVWLSHQASLHGGSARLKDDPLGQMFSPTEEEKAWRAAFKISRRVRCPRCNSSVFTRQSNLASHLATCGESRDATETPGGTGEVQPEGRSPGRSRRAAATRAQGRVAEFVKQMKSKFEGDCSSKEAEEDLLEDSDDNFELDEEFGTSSLYKFAKEKGNRIWCCIVCSSKFNLKQDVVDHVLADHQDELVADQESDSDYDIDEEYEESLPDVPVRSKYRPKKCEGSCSSNLRRPILEPSPELVEIERQYRTRCYGLNTFSSLTPRPSEWALQGQDSPYLPSQEISSKFTVSTRPTDGLHAEDVRVLERLQGGLINGKGFLFCGGPVWGLSWCPLPDREPSDQFVALACKLDKSPCGQSKAEGGPGLIQIWRCPGVGREKQMEAPMFQFGIGHKYGRVWRLEWCPSGAWSEERLGLLAAACSDGTVRIWSVPHSTRLQVEAVYKAEADLSLVCGQEKVGQCVGLSWYRGPHHRFIAASFTSGLVAVWDICTESPLLRQDRCLLPTQCWLAHSGSLTSLSLCPGVEEVPRYLVTGGTDRHYRFWDLRNPSVPVQESARRGLVTGVHWLPGWCAASVSFDDVYLQSHTQTLVAETGLLSTRSQPVIAQNSGVWDQDTAHWAGTLAVGTAAGELVVFVFPSTDRSMEHDKNVCQRRSYVFRTELDNETKDIGVERENCTIRYRDMPFKKVGGGDCPLEDTRRVRAPDRMDTEDLLKYPLAMVNRVAWNNNLGCHLWLVSGGEAGIVRLHYLEGLNTAPLKKVISETES